MSQRPQSAKPDHRVKGDPKAPINLTFFLSAHGAHDHTPTPCLPSRLIYRPAPPFGPSPPSRIDRASSGIKIDASDFALSPRGRRPPFAGTLLKIGRPAPR